MTTIARNTKQPKKRKATARPKRQPSHRQSERQKQKPQNENKAHPERAQRDEGWIAPFDSDNPKLGLPELLEAPPTTEIVVHALFTAQHLINELGYHHRMGNLTRADKHMLAQLGKEIIEELEQEV